MALAAGATAVVAAPRFPHTTGRTCAADGEILEANSAVRRRRGEVLELNAMVDAVSGTTLQTEVISPHNGSAKRCLARLSTSLLGNTKRPIYVCPGRWTK